MGVTLPEERSKKPRPILSEQLCFAIHAADQAFMQIYRPALARLDLTYPQFLVLMVLWERDNQTVGALGKAMHLQSNTLTPLLKRMAEAGFVVRTRDVADERAVRITLTERGRKLANEAPDVLDCAFRASGLTMDEVHELTGVLQRLNTNLRAAE